VAFVYRICCPREPQNITIEPGGEKAEHSWNGGMLEATLPELKIHVCLKIVDFARG